MRFAVQFVVFAVLMLALPGCAGCKSEVKHATLNFERTSSWCGRVCSMHVYVNDIKVGTAGNGDRLEVKFIPNASGRNTIYVELDALLGPDAKSAEVEFTATPGAVVSATSKIDAWVAKATADIHLKVVTLKEGVLPVEVMDVSLDGGVVRRAVTSEQFDVPPGTCIEVERTRALEHTVNVTESVSLEAGLGATLGPLTAGIKARVTTLAGQTVKTTETKKMSVKIDGTRTPKGDIVWVDHIRTGTARVKLNGIEKTIHFEYQENTELTVRSR